MVLHLSDWPLKLTITWNTNQSQVVRSARPLPQVVLSLDCKRSAYFNLWPKGRGLHESLRCECLPQVVLPGIYFQRLFSAQVLLMSTHGFIIVFQNCISLSKYTTRSFTSFMSSILELLKSGELLYAVWRTIPNCLLELKYIWAYSNMYIAQTTRTENWF